MLKAKKFLRNPQKHLFVCLCHIVDQFAKDLASWLCSYLKRNVQISIFSKLFSFEHYVNHSVTSLLRKVFVRQLIWENLEALQEE